MINLNDYNKKYSKNQYYNDIPLLKIDNDGNKSWYLNGEFHREDGPAICDTNGNKWWFLNGEQHREDGPAIILTDGTKEWYLNGKRHREDGPAVEFTDGDKWWYLNGKQLLERQFNKRNTNDGFFIRLWRYLTAEHCR